MRPEDLSSLINSMNSLTVPRIMLFGVKLLEPKDSSGWLTIQNSHLLSKRLVPEFITSWTNHGGVRFQKSSGVRLPNKSKRPAS